MLVLDFIIGRLHTVVEKFDRFVIEYYAMYMYVCVLMTDAGCSLWIEVNLLLLFFLWFCSLIW